MAVARVVLDGGGFVASIVIARLLSPAEMGRAAIALIVPMLATILAYEAFGSALVQRAAVTKADWSTSAFLSLVGGALLSITLASFALTLATDVFDARTAELLLIISPAFLVAGISANSRAQLFRELSISRVQLAEVASFVVGTTVSIGLAIAGFGSYALAIGALAGITADAAVVVPAARPARPRFERSSARSIVGYGGFSALNGFAFVLRRQSPFIVLGTSASPADAGLFYRAYQVGAENQGKVTNIVARLAFPLMSRTANGEDLDRVRRGMTRINALVVVPLLGLLVVTAPVLVPWIYGSQWTSAVLPAQILALAGAALALNVGTEQVLLASGKPRQLMWFTAVVATAIAVATAVAAPYGVTTVALVVAGVYLVQLAFAQRWLLGRVAGIQDRSFWATAAPPLVASLVAGVATEAIELLIAGFADFAVVALSTLVFGASYLACLRLIFPSSAASLSSAFGPLLSPVLRRLRPASRTARSSEAPAGSETRREASSADQGADT